MIRLEFVDAVALYLFLSVFSILALWIFFNQVIRVHDTDLKTEGVSECPFCLHVYVVSVHSKITKCPQCNSLVSENDKKNEGGRDGN